jgi:hypothetical protein
MPDFHAFGVPGDQLDVQEDQYKRAASAEIRSLLSPYVSSPARTPSDQDARAVVEQALGLTNLLNWRDKADISDTLFEEPGSWAEFLRRLVPCLSRAGGGDWQEPLRDLLGWLGERSYAARMSKLLPTYFLFFWDPQNHLFIKPRTMDQFLAQLGEPRTKAGVPLTVETYERVLGVFRELREALSDWRPRDNIDLHNFFWVTVSAKKPAGDAVAEPGVMDASEGPEPAHLPLNLILAGPPGTGKTYRLLHSYYPLFEADVSHQSLEEFASEACGELTWHEVCFVALALIGKPATVPEIVKTPALVAKTEERGRTQYVSNTLHTVLRTHTSPACERVRVAKRHEPFMFWKEEGKRWRLADDAEEAFPELVEIADRLRDYTPTAAHIVRHETVTFHQSYSYEDFVEGIKPVLVGPKGEESAGGIGYDVVPGVFRRVVRRATADPTHRYAIFIDEINRGNVANILGELITLIEPDKRMRYNPASEAWEGGIRVKLPYTHSSHPGEPPFGVPDNLHIIATMNTADRSIALLDHALRRRFVFEELMPDPEILATQPGPIKLEDGDIRLDAMLEAMNQRIEYLLDRDHTIGHSYFMNVQTVDDLERVFRSQILPLLQEYFYDDGEKIQLVLGDLTAGVDTEGRPRIHPAALVTHTPARPERVFGFEHPAFEARRLYLVAEEFSAQGFRKIYGAS